jgi:hypothetical protein
MGIRTTPWIGQRPIRWVLFFYLPSWRLRCKTNQTSRLSTSCWYQI